MKAVNYIIIITIIVFICYTTNLFAANNSNETVIVCFDLNYSFEETEKINIEVEKGQKINMPLVPERKDYQFLGWYLEEEVFDFDTVLESDVTLLAKWELFNNITYLAPDIHENGKFIFILDIGRRNTMCIKNLLSCINRMNTTEKLIRN